MIDTWCHSSATCFTHYDIVANRVFVYVSNVSHWNCLFIKAIAIADSFRYNSSIAYLFVLYGIAESTLEWIAVAGLTSRFRFISLVTGWFRLISWNLTIIAEIVVGLLVSVSQVVLLVFQQLLPWRYTEWVLVWGGGVSSV